MAVRCGICKEQIDLPIRNKLIDVRLLMFKRIMKKHCINKQQLVRCPLCDYCDQTLQNFYNCKADLASSNRDFLNHMDSENKLDLYQALVSMGKLKRFKNKSTVVKVCRICFKATQDADYREVKSWDGPLAKMITLCLPEFDININLTDHTYLCPDCYSSLLQYNHFLSLCLEVTKTNKRHLNDPDPLEVNKQDPQQELIEKKARIIKNMEKEKTYKKKVLRYECQVCSRVLSDIQELNEHMGKHEKGTKFLCRNCDFFCSDFKELKVHFVEQKIDLFRIIGDSQQVSQIPKKCQVLKAQQELTKNMQKEKPIKKKVLRYECQVCSKVLSDLQKLNKHMGKHGKETKFSCRNCDFFCSDFKELNIHFVEQKIDLFRIIGDSQQVSQIPKKCQVLKDNVINQRDKKGTTLSATEDSVLDEIEHYECQICPGVFDTIELLRDHINGHKSDHNFKCWKCGKKTYSYGSFRQHFMKHGFIDIYETKFTGLNDCSSNQNTSKDVGKKPVSSSKSIGKSIICATCKEKLNNLNEYLDHSCVSSSIPMSKISCTACTIKFDSLDELDEHSCNGEKIKSADIEDEANEATILPQTKDLDRPEIKKEELNRYECIGTARSEIKKDELNLHECIGTVSSETKKEELNLHECIGTVSSEIKKEELNLHECIGTVSDRIEDIVSLSDNYKIKKEDLFKCFSCLCFFDTKDKLSRHMCTTKTIEEVYDITEDLESKIKTEEIDLGIIENFEV